MNSLILSRMAGLIFWLLGLLSLYVLYRGHDMPGGGFVGGLMGAMAIAIIALADGIPAARARLRVQPLSLIAAGMIAALVSGLPGFVAGGQFLVHQWVEFPGGFKLGTTLLFDIGVYLVVLGGVLAIIFRLYDDGEESWN